MQLEKELLGKIIFTEKDETITGTSMRDPLGLQPIWSYYGRRVIKHLTTVSTDIRGFREVLLCLSVCGLLKDRYKDETFQNLILFFEQLFVYSAIEHGHSEGILGADNGIGKFRTAGKNPRISRTDTILVRQISLGYYGRYKTPLNTMGIIDRNSFVSGGINVTALYGSKLYHKILDAFDSFMKLKESDRTYKNFTASKDLIEAVCGEFRDGEKSFWLDRLQVSGENENGLMKACYEHIDENDSCKEVFDKLQYASEVRDIEKVEPFLRCMEYVFYKALESKKIQNIVLDSRMLEEHERRFQEFKTVKESGEAGGSLLERRLNYIRKECDPRTQLYVSSILSYHKMVCDQKHSSAWLESDTAGNIQTFVQPEFRIVDADAFLNEWGRNYYASALRRVKAGIGGLSV